MAVPVLLVKIFRAVPRASAATPVHVFSGPSVAADGTAAAVAAPTAGADVPIAADAPADRVSNAVPADRGMTVAIKAGIPVRRAVHSSFLKC